MRHVVFAGELETTVEGAWCCLSRLTNLVNEVDLKRVRRVGLDVVNATACLLKTSGEKCHLTNFASWDELEILYLGYEDVRLEVVVRLIPTSWRRVRVIKILYRDIR